MLFEALAMSVAVLAIVNLGYRWKKSAVWFAGACLAYLLATLFFFDPTFSSYWLRPRAVLIVQSLLLTLLAQAAATRSWSAVAFGSSSLLATLIAFAIIQAEPIRVYFSDYPHFREQYAFESMEQRAPAPRKSSGDENLSPAVRERLEIEETIVGERERAVMLKRLFEEPGDIFINSPGAGQVRHNLPNQFNLRIDPLPKIPLAQPVPAAKVPTFAAELGSEPAEKLRMSLLGLHLSAVREFMNRDGFGYVKDRAHVAGFQPHGFRWAPMSDDWKLQRLELVSVLRHDPPIVIVSDMLPRLDLADKEKTRPLNPFEQAGLKSLEAGEDWFVRESPEGTRMVGAIRSLSQCATCHGCRRGDLLGAISYWVTK